jgi:hypothetical protein
MHPSLLLLDKAIKLAEREFALIALDDAAGLNENAAERAELIESAWAGRAGCDELELVDKLSILQNVQNRLDSEAHKRYEETRDELKVRRQADRAISGYGNRLRRSMLAQVLAGEY